jgi:hypothetical protein
MSNFGAKRLKQCEKPKAMTLPISVLVLSFQLRVRAGHGPLFVGSLEAMPAFFKRLTEKILCRVWGDACDKSQQVFWFRR